jgi:hypothetical protein
MRRNGLSLLILILSSSKRHPNIIPAIPFSKTALTTIKGVIEVMVLVMGRCPSPNITAEINNG